MVDQKSRKRQARVLRNFRQIHKLSGISLFVFIFIMGLTGIVLGWKKNTGDLIMPQTRTGTSIDASQWLSVSELQQIALSAYKEEKVSDGAIDKIELRPEKGIAKFIFKEQNHELQLDGVTGAVLHSGRRYSDWFENLHDGSLVDDWLGLNGYFKVFYNTVMGLALTLFTVTGLWLWYGPKVLRRQRNSN